MALAESPLFVIVAGEASGDLLAGHIIKALREYYPSARFIGITGTHMREVGCESLFTIDDLSVMMFIEILMHLWKILKIRRSVIQYCLQQKPAAYIGVDAPALNLGIEFFLRRAGIKTVHYNSPKIWAWRPGRIDKIAQSCSLMLTQFPFEKELYDAKNIPAHYVGHPLADHIPLTSDKQQARLQCGITDKTPVLALLPGSRAQELKYLAEPFLLAAEQLHQSIPGGIQCIVPMVNEKRRQQFSQILQQLKVTVPIHLTEGASQTAMMASDAILLASGTATLEAMLVKRPLVVAYRLHALTYRLLRLFVRAEYFSLPNLISRQALVAEYLQEGVEPQQLAKALLPYLKNPDAPFKHQARFTQIHLDLRKKVAQQTASRIHEIL